MNLFFEYKRLMYTKFLNKVYDQNKGLIWSNAILTLTIYPVEIIVLSWISGLIFLNTNQKNFDKLWFYVCLFFIILLSIVIMKYIREMIDAKIIPSINTVVRIELFDQTTNKKNGIQDIQSGEFITRLQKVPYCIYMGYMNTLCFLLPFVLTIISFICFLFYINWKIGLSSFFFLTLFCVFLAFGYLKLSQCSYNRYVHEVSQGNEFADMLHNKENISLHSTYDQEKKHLLDKEKYLKSSFLKELQNMSLFKTISIIIMGIYSFLIILYGCYLVTKNKLPMFKLIILVTSVLLMIRNLDSIIRRFVDTVMEFGPLWNDKKFFNNITTNYIHYGTRTNFLQNYELKIENLSFSIDKIFILNDINLTINYKENILITGDIGSGKSTLLKLLCGYYYPTSGNIYIDKVRIQDIDITYFRDHITMMHQRIELFRRPVLENIFYGSKIKKEQQLTELKKLSIYSNIEPFLDQKDATLLSGGQKQVVVLLRCFFKYPKILILDEPTANLDPNIKKIIINIIQLLIHQCTIICVSHDSTIFSLFSKHYIMNKGSLKNR